MLLMNPGRIIAGVVIALSCPGVSVSASRADEAMLAFNIPAQSLASALEQYTLRTGVQVFYPSTLAAGRRSSTVSGAYSPQEALLVLLEGAGVRPRMTAADAVTLEALPDERTELRASGIPHDEAEAGDVIRLGPLVVSATVEPSLRRHYAFYAISVRAAVSEALRKEDRLQARRYRMGVSLWLADDGRVEQVSVRRSSGDQAVDASVLAVIGKVVVQPQPPAGLPQPVHVDLSGGAMR